MTTSVSTQTRLKKFLIPTVTFLIGAIIVLVPCVVVIARNSKDQTNHTPASVSRPWNKNDYQTNSEYYKDYAEKSLKFDHRHNTRLDRLSSPRFRPSDGSFIIYLRRQYHMPDCNGSSTTIHLTFSNSTSIETSIQLTRPMWGIQDQQIFWIDNQTILFLSNRAKSGLTQIFQLNLPKDPAEIKDFIEPIQITDYPLSINNLLVNRQSTRLAFSCEVYPNLTIEQTAERKLKEKFSRIRVSKHDKLFVRHWDEYMVGLRHHPFVVSIKKDTNGIFQLQSKPTDVLFDIDSDSPTRPFGDAKSEWSFNSNGNLFAFTRQYDETSSVAWSTNLDVFQVDLTKTNLDIECLTCENNATDTNPIYSPTNENVLIYRSHSVPGYESDKYQLKLYDHTLKSKTALLQNVDLSVEGFTWSHNGRSLFVEIPEKAVNTLYQITDLQSKTQNMIKYIDVGTTRDVNIHPKDPNVILFTHTSLISPVNIYLMNLNDKRRQPKTNHNENLLKSVIISDTYEHYNFSGANSEIVYGWHLVPPGDLSKKTPLAFLIHGGPQSSWDDIWGFGWSFQVYAGQGFSVVAINFHGSDSYGQNFTDSITGNYGSLPYDDLKLGLTAALNKYSYIDENRAVALGASYGGYMINWIAGHPEMSKRFRTLINHCGLFDMREMGYATEELFFTEHDAGGSTPYENPDAFEQYNPIKHVANWTQPMLVIHGALDYRVPETQGIAAFTALQRRNISSRLVFFPTENHWTLNPLHSIIWFDEVFDWINKWIK